MTTGEPITFADVEPDPVTNTSGLIVDIDDYRASVPTKIAWRPCRPLAYSGGVTLLAGPPKAGKSTLAAQMQRACETGDDFLGVWPVVTGPVLLVTEESGVAVVYKTAGIHKLHVLDHRTVIRAELTFAQVLDVIREWGFAYPGGLVFIDTFAIWARIENENDASEASRAVAMVTAVAQASDLAIVLIRGGQIGRAHV